jgi:predicted transcriptional regulator
MFMKWMTSPKALDREPRAPPRTMLADSFNRVFRTRWIEAAIVEGKNGREKGLIQSYEKNEWVSHDFPTS